MNYTVKHLETQKAIIEQRIVEDKAYQKHVLSDAFLLAKEYGDEIRMNHYKTTQNRINANEKKLLELKFAIQDKIESEEN